MCVAVLRWDRRPSKAYLSLPHTRPFPHSPERARSARRPVLYFLSLPVWEIAAHKEQDDFVDVDLVHAEGVPNLYPLLEHVGSGGVGGRQFRGPLGLLILFFDSLAFLTHKAPVIDHPTSLPDLFHIVVKEDGGFQNCGPARRALSLTYLECTHCECGVLLCLLLPLPVSTFHHIL